MAVSVVDPFNVVSDRTMPSLRLALDPKQAERQIERAMRSYTGQADRVRLRAIRVTRHKPEKRCLIEYDLRVARSRGVADRITLIGKVRARRFGSADYRLQRAVWHAGFHDRSPDGVSVPEPVGFAPKLHMWFQRKLRGQPATALLAGPGGEQLARQIAEAACKLHRLNVRSGRRHTMADELRVLRGCLDSVVHSRPTWFQRIRRLWAACQRVAHATPDPVPTGIHRDFYADQLIVSRKAANTTAGARSSLRGAQTERALGLATPYAQPADFDGRIYILDFDLYCEGDPGLDIGNFIGHITEHSVRTLGVASALAHVERAMEDRFVELADEATRARAAVRAYAVLTLVRHVYLSLRFPERRHLTESLLSLCEQRLGVITDQPAILADEVLTP